MRIAQIQNSRIIINELPTRIYRNLFSFQVHVLNLREIKGMSVTIKNENKTVMADNV